MIPPIYQVSMIQHWVLPRLVLMALNFSRNVFHLRTASVWQRERDVPPRLGLPLNFPRAMVGRLGKAGDRRWTRNGKKLVLRE